MQAEKLLGSDHTSFAYDGYLVRDGQSVGSHAALCYCLSCLFVLQSRKWHKESENFGRRWKSGDVVGCLLDIEEATICEGKWLTQRYFITAS